jgi:hypothetical protein
MRLAAASDEPELCLLASGESEAGEVRRNFAGAAQTATVAQGDTAVLLPGVLAGDS